MAKSRPAKKRRSGKPSPPVTRNKPPDVPTVDRKHAIRTAVERALDGASLIAVFRLDGGNIVLDRYSEQFPTGDLPLALEMLREHFAREAPWLFK